MSSVRLLVVPLGGPVALGVVVGLAWWALAPTPTVVELGDHTLVSATVPEFAAAQAGLLVLLSAGAGLLCGVLAAVWPGRAPVRRSLAVLVASAAGSLVAAALGHLLGPAPVAAQRAATANAALSSPVSIQTPTVLLVWPALAAVVMAIGHLAAARRQAREEAADVEEGEEREEREEREEAAFSPPSAEPSPRG